MRIKILVSIFLLSALVSTAFASAMERMWPVFPDVEAGSYYENALHNIYNKGVVSGYSNGNFGPNDPLTRAQMVTILNQYDVTIVNKLEKENAYLKTLVCSQFETADSLGANYKQAWNETCGPKAEAE